MPTLSDTIDLISGTFTITPYTAPTDQTGNVITGKPRFVATSSAGAFSVTLDNAYYVVRIPHTPPFLILMPTSGTVDFEDVFISDIPSIVTGPDTFFATLTLFKASTSTADLIGLGADANGDAGVFYRGGSAGEAAEEDVNWILRTDGTYFQRLNA